MAYHICIFPQNELAFTNTQNGNARKLNTPIEIMEKENKTDLRYKLEMDFVSYKIFFISILMLIAKKKKVCSCL